MSQPPPPYPVPGENDRGARAPTPAFGAGGYTPFAVPAQALQYDSPATGTRPGLITAVAVMSIVIASLSGLASLVSGLQAAGYYMMSIVTSSAAAAQARTKAVTMAPPVVVGPGRVRQPGQAGVMEVGPQGMAPPQRQAAVAALTKRQPLTPSSKRQLDAILAAAGNSFGVDEVTEAGMMPQTAKGDPPQAYFVTRAGRLEVSHDRATFFPSNGSQIVRVSAPPPGPEGPGADGAATAEPAAEEGVDVSITAEPDAGAVVGVPTSAPATGPAATLPVSAALSTIEAQAVVQQAQSLSGNTLNAAQVATLQSLLTGVGQQLVQPGASQGAVVLAFTQADGSVVMQFADGGSLTIGAQGNVVSMVAAPIIPTFSFTPWAIGLQLVVAIASLALAVFLLVTGIMTLRQSPRGRRLHLIYACIKIPLAIAAGVASAQVARDFAAAMAAMPGGAAAAAGAGGWSLFSGVIPVILGCAYPIALLIVLNLKPVREYYRFSGAEPAGAAV